MLKNQKDHKITHTHTHPMYQTS